MSPTRSSGGRRGRSALTGRFVDRAEEHSAVCPPSPHKHHGDGILWEETYAASAPTGETEAADA